MTIPNDVGTMLIDRFRYRFDMFSLGCHSFLVSVNGMQMLANNKYKDEVKTKGKYMPV